MDYWDIGNIENDEASKLKPDAFRFRHSTIDERYAYCDGVRPPEGDYAHYWEPLYSKEQMQQYAKAFAVRVLLDLASAMESQENPIAHSTKDSQVFELTTVRDAAILRGQAKVLLEIIGAANEK